MEVSHHSHENLGNRLVRSNSEGYDARAVRGKTGRTADTSLRGRGPITQSHGGLAQWIASRLDRSALGNQPVDVFDPPGSKGFPGLGAGSRGAGGEGGRST